MPLCKETYIPSLTNGTNGDILVLNFENSGEMVNKIKKKLTNYQIIALAYLTVILLGTALLALPISAKSGEATPFVDALFTASSATCITGLVVFDTFLHWSLFGQIVILLLIQIGGMGFMTLMTMALLFARHHLTLSERSLIAQSASSPKIGVAVKVVKYIVAVTFLFETVGAGLLMIRYIPLLGWRHGVWVAIFNSVSAFCNAGFDLLGALQPFSSLTYFALDPLVNTVVMVLIVTGGLGFLVWRDVVENKFSYKKFSLHTVVVLWTTLALIIGGAALFLGFEWNGAFADMTVEQKIMAAFFQSVTPRTAGFFTVAQTSLGESSRFLTIVLMFIGGSPGSTAGGIKTTAFAVVIFTIASLIRRRHSVVMGKRRLEESTVREAFVIVSIYIITIVLSGLAIAAIEPLSLEEVLYEIFSALSNVGLSLNVTPTLSAASKLILSLLMYCGKVGMFTLIMVFANKKPAPPIERPVEKIVLG